MNWLTKHPYFSHPGRTFFPLVALMGILVPMWTVTFIVNDYPFDNGHFGRNIFEWHGFEMLYGFFYTLTMVACLHHKKLTPQGSPLIALWILWLIDLAVLYFSQSTGLLQATGIVLHLFFQWLLGAENKKLLFIASTIGLLKILFICFKLFGIYWLKELCYEYTILFFCLLSLEYISKTYPTPIWVKQTNWVLFAGLLVTPLIENPLAEFTLYFSAGFMALIKLYYSNGIEKLRTAISGMEIVSYFVITTGLIIHGCSYFYEDLLYTRATLHLLLTGGFSVLVLKIMLEITGDFLNIQDFNKERTLKLMYILILVGGLIRFGIPAFHPERFKSSLHHSMGYWTLTLLIYLIIYGRKCFKKATHC